MSRKIALLLGNGHYATTLHRRLRRESDVACMTVSLFPDGLAGVNDDMTDHLGGLVRPSACIRWLQRKNITHVVLGGDVRLAELSWQRRVEIGARATGDGILRRMVFSFLRGNTAGALNVFSKAIAARNIQAMHAADLLPELKVPDGIVVRHGRLADWTQSQLDAYVTRLARQAHSELRQQPYAHVRQALLFEKEKIRLRETRGTDRLLERAVAEPVQRRPRVLVKLCPLDMDYKMDPPVVGLKTFELARDAGVDLAILDSTAGVLVDREDVLKFCAENGISLYGFPPA